MENKPKNKIKLVSSDLNGTLVHQHTMMDMIRVYFPYQPERYEKAKEAFTRQTSGLLSMKDAFKVAGPLTKGLSLRNAIEYACSKMQFLDGFEEFVSALYKNKKYFVINSTVYSVTTEVIRSLYGSEKIHAVISNHLIFGWEGDPTRAIEEEYLAQLVKDYFQGRKSENVYDQLLATGEVALGIQDEEEKAQLLFKVSKKLSIPRTQIAHIGDTMGDSVGIYEVAKNGGMGIAFNYNEALRNYLEQVLKSEEIPGTIILAEPKSKASNLKKLLNILL